MPKMSRGTEEQAERRRRAAAPEDASINELIAGLYAEIRELRQQLAPMMADWQERRDGQSTDAQFAAHTELINDALSSDKYSRGDKQFLERVRAWGEAYGHYTKKQMAAVSQIAARMVKRAMGVGADTRTQGVSVDVSDAREQTRQRMLREYGGRFT